MERPVHPDPAVEKAAMWLADQKTPPPMLISHLREDFALSALQASQACGLAQRFRTYRKAHG